MFPPPIEPPISTISFMRGMIAGSRRTAIAMLVKGPTATSVISFGEEFNKL